MGTLTAKRRSVSASPSIPTPREWQTPPTSNVVIHLPQKTPPSVAAQSAAEDADDVNGIYAQLVNGPPPPSASRYWLYIALSTIALLVAVPLAAFALTSHTAWPFHNGYGAYNEAEVLMIASVADPMHLLAAAARAGILKHNDTANTPHSQRATHAPDMLMGTPDRNLLHFFSKIATIETQLSLALLYEEVAAGQHGRPTLVLHVQHGQ